MRGIPLKKKRLTPKGITLGRKSLKSKTKRRRRELGISKPKVWSLTKADEVFSTQIRKRDGRCLYQNCPVSDVAKLQCSHYVGRATKSTRFDPDNCISLCWHHHFKSKEYGYEYQKQRKEVHGWDGQYTIFMKKWLGTERFEALLTRSKVFVTQPKAIQAYQLTQ